MTRNIQFKKALAGLVAATALVFPAGAVAQGSAEDAYRPQGQIEQDVQGDQGGVGGSPGAGGGSPGAGGGSGGETASANSGAGLPFTGVDVALLAGAGALLLGAGVGMRRLAYRQDLA
jgi:hypothetical protein